MATASARPSKFMVISYSQKKPRGRMSNVGQVQDSPKSSIPEQQIIQAPVNGQELETRNNLEQGEAFKHTWDITGVFCALLLLAFMSSIDGTIVTTSLPTIAREIGGGEKYICKVPISRSSHDKANTTN
ncbi:hypothetical protein HYFRA_00010504 [Hymenoscyphus fraxineus]|uniref:Uncharacterized protein n=1 Tax=Hymenoscyphus fraxineus TaxID=746836 RepID=A0A9N9PXH5_9HELO|nr:hypothetical protein HYFRA_00010504 [Hymenoscyphus fraxineus]